MVQAGLAVRLVDSEQINGGIKLRSAGNPTGQQSKQDGQPGRRHLAAFPTESASTLSEPAVVAESSLNT